MLGGLHHSLTFSIFIAWLSLLAGFLKQLHEDEGKDLSIGARVFHHFLEQRPNAPVGLLVFLSDLDAEVLLC